MKKYTVKFALWALVLIWMAVIFSFSSESAEESTETSDGIVDVVIDRVLETVEEDLSKEEHESLRMKISHIVRKCAHFAAFMLLGILARAALAQHTPKILLGGAATLGGCALYAVSDEIHQHFVPGRACRFTDVLIDSSGSLCGILLVTAAILIIRRIKMKNNS